MVHALCHSLILTYTLTNGHFSTSVFRKLILTNINLRYPRYGEDPDTGWSRGTQILGASHSYLAGVGKNALSQIIVKQQRKPTKRKVI